MGCEEGSMKLNRHDDKRLNKELSCSPAASNPESYPSDILGLIDSTVQRALLAYLSGDVTLDVATVQMPVTRRKVA
jgi:hypothetical protein